MYSKQYAIGLMVCGDNVAMVRKSKPMWQKGLLNLPGGHVEPGETFRQAVVREFREETQVETFESDWTLKLHVTGPGYNMDVFVCRVDKSQYLKGTEAEPALWVSLKSINWASCIPNLQWLIPLCLDETVEAPTLLTFTQ